MKNEKVLCVVIVDKFHCQNFALNEKSIYVSKEDLEQIGKTKCFDVQHNCVIDYDKNSDLEIVNKEKLIKYENKIVALIRQKYNVNQELAILRQRDAKPQEFAEYNEYVEQCKEQVKNEL